MRRSIGSLGVLIAPLLLPAPPPGCLIQRRVGEEGDYMYVCVCDPNPVYDPPLSLPTHSSHDTAQVQ